MKGIIDMIRHAVINDLEEIVRIYNEAIPLEANADIEPVEVNDKLQWFNEHSSEKYPIFVYVINTQVVGWIAISAYRFGRGALSYTAEISYYIDNKYKEQGIATKLFNYVINNCWKYNIKNLFAIVLEHNIPSIKLLEKFNFKKWGKLPKVANFNSREYAHLYYGIRVENFVKKVK
jgi:phosphinothricin acetyltransferase